MSTAPPPPPGDPTYPPQTPPAQTSRGDTGSLARRLSSPETKEFFKSSEFAVWALTIVAVLIAGLVSDVLDAGLVWTLVVVTSFAYILSRGIAKSGTKHGGGDRL